MSTAILKKPIRARDVFGSYLKAARRYPWLWFALFLGTIGIQAAELTTPIYLRRFFNLIATYDHGPETVQQLTVIVGIIAIISVCGWIARRTQVYSVMAVEARVMTDLYSSAFAYLIRHSYQFFISRFSGTLTRRITKFAAAFETITDGITLQFFPTAVFTAGAVTILFLRSQVLGIALGIWVVCFVAFQLFVARLRRPLRVARSKADSAIVGALSDAISNQNTIALFSATQHERGLFARVVEDWRRALMRSWHADELIWSVQGILAVGINVGLLYGAMRLWQKGLVTIGDFVLIQSYLLGLFDRLFAMNREVRRFYDAYADAVEMTEIIKAPHEVQDRPGATALVVTRGEIAFKKMSFRFGEVGRAVLKDFNLTVRGGEKLALVGPSGAGKSTVTKLLLRLYDVEKGSIEIDGQNIAAITQDSLRNAIAFVPQEPILFHRTLMENIQYGRRGATEKEVIAAAKKAHCHEFIAALPEGYKTYVGERGVRLSGGERQRVAIARAILKNAPILVLDEATSSLDSESESLIQDALRALMKGKTVVVIAHRLSTIMEMDRIVVIDKGRVVAEGTHRELLDRGGLYQKLWNIQAGGFADDAG